MIKEFKTSKGEFLGVLVPEDAYCFDYVISRNKIICWTENGTRFIKLPSAGQYKIIGIQTEITEEQAETMVDDEIDWSFKTGFVNYLNPVTV